MYVCMRCDVCICVYGYLEEYGICTVRYLIKKWENSLRPLTGGANAPAVYDREAPRDS